MSDLNIQETYIYKLHLATSKLDDFLDRNLKKHAGLTLTQLLLLQAVKQLQPVKQGEIARFLLLNPPTLSRQVEVARKKGWLTIDKYDDDDADRRVRVVGLTPDGNQQLQKSLQALEKFAFHIFEGQNTPLSLMQHIDKLLNNMKEEKPRA